MLWFRKLKMHKEMGGSVGDWSNYRSSSELRVIQRLLAEAFVGSLFCLVTDHTLQSRSTWGQRSAADPTAAAVEQSDCAATITRSFCFLCGVYSMSYGDF